MFKRVLILCIVSLILFACEKSTEPVYDVAKPTFNPAAGLYFSPLVGELAVKLNCPTNEATMRYTLDGTEPTTSSTQYITPLEITQATIVKVRAYKSKMNPSPIASAAYSFSVGTVYITPLSGTFTAPQTVTMSSVTAGTVIRYTLDGTDPTESSTIYTDPFAVDGNIILKARGFINGWNSSAIETRTYSFNTTAPTFSVPTGTYGDPFDVTLNTTTTGASIYYTTDGTEPTETSNLYTIPININTTKTVKAKTIKTNWNSSAIVSAVYTMKVAPPAFNPAANTFSTPQEVSISTVTPNSTLYYTTDGSAPTAESTPYAGPVYIDVYTVLKAIAIRTGWSDSNVTTGSYNFKVATPTFNPPNGLYPGEQIVTISCATSGAEIRYTTNNTEPTTSSSLYTGPITVAQTSTIKAKGYKANWNTSNLATAYYQITNTVANPVFNPEGGIYFDPQEVTITCATDAAEIYYTTDGTEPTTSSTLFYYPIQISADTEIKAKGFKLGYTPSETVSALYQFDSYDQIVAWGLNTYNQTNVPIGTEFAQIDAGMYHTVALRNDGSLVAWGRNNFQQCNYPTGNDYIAVSAGDNHCLALKTDGTIVAWGNNDSLQCEVPPDSLGYQYAMISAGGNHSLALTLANKIVAWGANDNGQCNVPPDSNFVKISAGANHNLALKSTGVIVAWGNNDSGQINAPTGTGYQDISAGDQHSVAQRTNGSLVAWGSNTSGQTTVPGGTDFIKFSAGYRHNIALKTDGSLVTWGYSGNGLGTVPTLSTYIDVSAGRDFSVVLKTPSTTRKLFKLKNLKPRIRLK